MISATPPPRMVPFIDQLALSCRRGCYRSFAAVAGQPIAAAPAFHRFHLAALAEAEAGVDDMKIVETDPAENASEQFLHGTVLRVHQTATATNAGPQSLPQSCPGRSPLK